MNTTRRSLALVIAMTLGACESNTATDVTPTRVSELATVRVESHIEGDISLFSNSYVATVDGSSGQSMIAGFPAMFSVTAGPHIVAIQRSSNFSSPCTTVQPMLEAIKITAGTEKAVTFAFNCGSPSTSGTLRLTIMDPSGKAPEVDVILRAGLTVRTDRSYQVQTNKTREFTLAPNFYQLGISSAVCPLEGGIFSALPSAFYVVSGTMLDIVITLKCQ